MAARVRQLAEQKRFNAKTLGEAVNVPPSSADNYWKGKRPWPISVVGQLALVLHTNVEFLILGEDPPPTSGTAAKNWQNRVRDASASYERAASALGEGEVEIDSLDLSYGMGGTFVDVEPGTMEIEKVRFSRNWLRKFTHSSPELLFTTSGVGDSMRPTIEDHDVVIVDRSARLQDELGEKIWAVVFGGVGMIKRLRPMPDGTVKLMSDNPSVPPEIATDNDLYIVGRVVAVVRRH